MNRLIFDETQVVAESILKPIGEPKNFILTISQFKLLYQQLSEIYGNTRVDIVLNGKWALVQFSEICNHRIRIFPDNHKRPLLNFFNIRLFLEKDDFEIVYQNVRFYGQEEFLTTGRFLIEEIQVNGLRTSAIIIFSIVFLHYFSSDKSIQAANELLIVIGSIFFSIFILFTVNQNLPLIKLPMFKKGLTHRFMSVDAKITHLVIFVIGLSFFNLILSNITSLTQEMYCVLVISTSFSIGLMGISLLTVVQYYFSRIKMIYETDMSKKILTEAFEESNKEQ